MHADVGVVTWGCGHRGVVVELGIPLGMAVSTCIQEIGFCLVIQSFSINSHMTGCVVSNFWHSSMICDCLRALVCAELIKLHMTP